MTSINCKYKATIEIDFSLIEDKKLFSFYKVKDSIENEITPFLQKVIKDELALLNNSTVKITQEDTDCYISEDNKI